MPRWNTDMLKRIVGIVATLLIVGAALIALLAREAPAPTPPPDQQPSVEQTPRSIIPAALPNLGRRDLLAAASVAADAVAAGLSPPPGNRALIGRRFELRLPIGCEGPAPSGQGFRNWAEWSFDPQRSALRLRARPEPLSEIAWIGALAEAMRAEAVEGFWIDRPWTNAESCPPNRATSEDASQASATAPADPQILAIAQFFGPDSPRTLRRGDRPYAVTVKADARSFASPRHFNLIVRGRIADASDGQPVRCRDNGPARRPSCLIAVRLSNVAFEDPADGSMLAEWTG